MFPAKKTEGEELKLGPWGNAAPLENPRSQRESEDTGRSLTGPSICQWRRCRRRGFDTWVRKIPWRRKRQLPPVFSPGEMHGQRSLSATVHGVAHQLETTWPLSTNHPCFLHEAYSADTHPPGRPGEPQHPLSLANSWWFLGSAPKKTFSNTNLRPKVSKAFSTNTAPWNH